MFDLAMFTTMFDLAVLATCCKRRSESKAKTRNEVQRSSCMSGARKCLSANDTTVSRTNCRNDRRRTFSGETEGKNRDRQSFRVYIATNKELTNQSRAGPEALRDYIWRLCQERQPLNDVNVATIFHSSAKYPFILTSDVLNYLMDALDGREMDARALGNTVYGLQGLTNSAATHRVLRIMSGNLHKCKEDFTPQQLGNALYGLQNMKDSPEVRDILRVLEWKTRMSNEQFSVQGLASACFGMRSLCESAEVRSIINVLAAKAEQLNGMHDTQQAMAQMPGSLQKTLHKHMDKKSFSLDGWGIGNTLYGLQNLGDSPEVRRMLAAITIQMENLVTPMKAQEVCTSFYGLKSFHGAPPEIRRLLSALAKQLKACSETFLPRHIASSLYGLRWLGESDEGKTVLAVFTEKIRQCQQAFDGQAIGNALYGLQSHGNSKEMHGILEALRPKVENSCSIMTTQEIGNAFYGLRTVEDCTEVRRMLVALTPKLEQRQEMDQQAISNAMFGLHSFGSVPQTQTILKLLAPKIKNCRGVFTPQAISNAFSGLQTMEDSPITRSIVAILAPKLADCKDMKPEHIGNVLINFRTVGDSDEVRAILTILQDKIYDCKESFYSQHITTAFVGLGNLRESPELLGVLQALVPRVARCKNFSARDITNCLYSIKILHDSAVARSFLKAFTPKVVACSDPLHSSQLKRLLQGFQGLGDSIEVQTMYRSLASLANRSSTSVEGTVLESIQSDAKQTAVSGKVSLEYEGDMHSDVGV